MEMITWVVTFGVRETRAIRVVIGLLCLALLLCLIANPAGTRLDLAVFLPVFCFLILLVSPLLVLSDKSPLAQPLSFLTLNISRAPPLA